MIDWSKKALRIAGRRLPVVSLHLAWNFIPASFSLLASALVVRLQGPGLWGDFVFAGLVVFFLNLTLQLGIKDQLLREFSSKPSAMLTIWVQQVQLRFYLFPILLFVPFFLLPAQQAASAGVWLILAFLNRSFEVFFLFQKRFRPLVFSEVLFSSFFLVLLFLVQGNINLNTLLLCQVLGTLAKSVFLFFHVKSFLSPIKWKWSKFTLPVSGFGFYLLALVGFLEAKTDLLCLKALSNSVDLGRYSLVFSLLLTLKLLPDFFMGPFVKNFYRSEDAVFRKLRFQLALVGMLVCVPGLLAIRWFSSSLYNIHFSWTFFLVAFFYVFPRYLFAMDSYSLFQLRLERYLIWATAFAMGLNAAINVILIPRFGADSTIAGAAIGQFFLAGFFAFLRFKGVIGFSATKA